MARIESHIYLKCLHSSASFCQVPRLALSRTSNNHLYVACDLSASSSNPIELIPILVLVLTGQAINLCISAIRAITGRHGRDQDDTRFGRVENIRGIQEEPRMQDYGSPTSARPSVIHKDLKDVLISYYF
jgi:hypothetical protein